MYPCESNLQGGVNQQGRLTKSIQTICSPQGEMLMRHKYNENLFDTWTEESAYALGWLATDGCVQYVPGERYGIRWELTDLDAIKTLLSIFSATNGVYTRETGGKPLYSIYLRGQHIVRRVMDLGITPRKTHSLKYPPVPKELHRHFIRGVLDGDGSVLILNKSNGGKQLTMKICGASKEFLESIGKILSDELEVITKIYEEQPGFYVLRYGAKESFSILRYLYHDATVFLQRKFDRYQEAINISAGNSIAQCKRCGIDIVRVSNRQKWCAKCRRIVVHERDNKRHKERRKSI